jgi:DNA-binding transcriptional MerR regulator
MRMLAIKDVAERSGVAAGTIRMWEQRYGFPEPQRTASGYRRYSEADVEALIRVAALRERGLSVPAAIERAQAGRAPDRPSLFAAISGLDPAARPQRLRRSTLSALSRAIEHEALAQAARPVVFGAFQREANYDAVRPRWQRLAQAADAAVVFADFPTLRRPPDAPVEVPIAHAEQLSSEWAVIVDAPGLAASLLAWELPGERAPGGEPCFEALWTLDPGATRRAAHVAARLAAAQDEALGAELEERLAGRPLAFGEPAPALTALTNRLVAYLEQAARPR